MVKLRTLKNSNLLRQHTDLRPIIRCKTRWNGAFRMVKRFFEMKESIKLLAEEDEYLDDLLHLIKKDSVQLSQ